MNWLLVILAITGVLAGPVVAGVVAPGLMTQAAEKGFSVRHRHFVIDESMPVRTAHGSYVVEVRDGDLYELPLSTQAVVRGTITPAPDDKELRAAFQKAIQRYHLPVLSFDVERSGKEVTVHATLPAGMMAQLSKDYRDLVQRYESPG